MQAIRINRIIKDDRIAEIRQFIGRKVEIIIRSDDDDDSNGNESSIENPLLSFRGSCPNIIDGLQFQNQIRNEWEK